MKKICILGSGSWGTAIASVLANNGHQVTLWCFLESEYEMFHKEHEHTKFLPGVKLPNNVDFTMDMKNAVEDKDIIVIGVPSFAVRETAKKLKEFYKDNQIIVSISKGFEEATLSCLTQVVENEIATAKVCVLSGPSHAEEVGKKMPTTCVSAAYDIEIAKEIQDAFMCDYFRVYTTTDVIGVQLGAALKNVISLCAGISDGLGYGDNLKAALMTRGMAEIMRLGIKMGGKADTFFGLTGMGDLIVTCTSMHSRNRRAGILIGEGKSPKQAQEEVGMVVEGIITCKSAYDLSKKHNIEMPIVQEAYAVLYEHKDVKNSMLLLMQRDKKSE